MSWRYALIDICCSHSEVARHNKLAVYAPSSIAAFGPNLDLENVKDDVILKPQTIYGVSKVRLLFIYYYFECSS